MSFWEPSFIRNPQPFYAEGKPCENCGVPYLGDRIWIPGFEYWACSDCAEECQILVFAEENCPTLYDAIMRARSVQQVRTAFQAHKLECPKCSAVKSGQRAEAGEVHVTLDANCDDLPRYPVAANQAVAHETPLETAGGGTGQVTCMDSTSVAPRKGPVLASVQGEDEQERAA